MLACASLGPVGCAGTRAVQLAPELVETLASTRGGFLSGPVRAVIPTRVIEDRDFAYAAAFSPDGARVAYIHLDGDGFRLAVAPIDGPREARLDVLLGPGEFDVEGLAFTPDGAHVVTAGRDGFVRRLSSTGEGTLEALGVAEAPLTSVAIHPSGTYLAAGDVAGTVRFFSLPALLPMGQLTAHRDEVHGLAFTPEGVLVTGGWDRTVARHALEVARGEVRTATLRPLREEGQVHLRATLNGLVQAPLLLDARAPHVVLTRAAAERAIPDAALTETVELQTAMGTQRAPLARGVKVRLQELVLTLDVALCDACVPKGAKGVLGAPFAEQVEVRFEQDGAARLTLRDGVEAAVSPTVAARELARHEVGAFVNALSLDASGRRVALALSEAKAVRTREVYQREKDGVVEPLAFGNAAVVLELEGFTEQARQSGHHGVVSAVALSPDGQTLASGGWDRRVLIRPVGSGAGIGSWKGGWSIRELRFSADGRQLVAGAWTPIVTTGSGQSEPSVQVFALDYAAPRVVTTARDP